MLEEAPESFEIPGSVTREVFFNDPNRRGTQLTPPGTPPQTFKQAQPPRLEMYPQPFRQQKVRRTEEEENQREEAYERLQSNPLYQKAWDDRFEYDSHQREYKEKRKRYYTYHPIVQGITSDYQLGATIADEEVIFQPRHRDIEHYVRTDVHDVAKRFTEEGKRKRPMAGRAKNFMQVGPWIKLRFLMSTIHISVKGTPPMEAYEILASHLNKQIKSAKKPRIIMPYKYSKKKRHMLTLATTERLMNITVLVLTQLLRKGLGRRGRHIIYRQSNKGGPFFERAKTEDALYK
jgi:hypothetical protein